MTGQNAQTVIRVVQVPAGSANSCRVAALQSRCQDTTSSCRQIHCALNRLESLPTCSSMKPTDRWAPRWLNLPKSTCLSLIGCTWTRYCACVACSPMKHEAASGASNRRSPLHHRGDGTLANCRMFMLDVRACSYSQDTKSTSRVLKAHGLYKKESV